MLLVLVLCTFGLSAALDSRVYKGQDLRYNVHNYLVMLETQRESPAYCSGSVISNRWIITAAHCVYGYIRKIIVNHSDGTRIRQIAIVNKFDTRIHPKYLTDLKTPANAARDVGLIYLRKQLQLSSYINFITLADFHPTFGETGMIAGYGHHESYVKAPREGAVIIATSSTENGVITAFGPSWVAHGDSGGPLIVRGKLAGVISETCNTTLARLSCESLYASVAANLNWIQLVTNSIV